MHVVHFQAEAGWRRGFTFFPQIVLLRHPGSSPHFSYQRVHMKPNSTVSSIGQIHQETSVSILTARHVEVEHNSRLITRGRWASTSSMSSSRAVNSTCCHTTRSLEIVMIDEVAAAKDEDLNHDLSWD